MTGLELLEMINKRIYPTIKFSKDILDIEDQLEEGMLGKVISAFENTDDEIQVEIDETDFVEFNKGLEVACIYDEQIGLYNKKWSEIYPRNPRITVYLSKDDVITYFEIVEDSYSELVKEYNDSNSNLTYVEWLQEQVFMLRALV